MFFKQYAENNMDCLDVYFVECALDIITISDIFPT